VQLNVGLRFRKSVDYIRHEEVAAEKGRLELNNPRISIRELEFGHFPAPEEPDVCSAPLQRRAGSGGAECLSASSEIVGARLQSH
jgi:hypothetical protein